LRIEESLLFKKVYGALTGGALGDAMGAPIEGWRYETIQEKYGWVSGIITDSGRNGQFTDDTYVKNALCREYIQRKTHLTAADVVKMWAGLDPQRLWLPEKYTHLCARYTRVDPFFAGKGNIVICGGAMHIAPVGLVNAGNPQAAYREATSVAAINTHSFGLEGAAVLAAGIAEAMRPDADRDSVFLAALDVAHGGTRQALKEVYETVCRYKNVREAIVPVREVTSRWDGRLAAGNPGIENPDKCLEEVAAAFAMCYLAQGNTMEAIEGGVNFGQDNDSIAGMAGALAGALYAGAGLRPELVAQVEQANEYDAVRWAREMSEAIIAIQTLDRHHLEDAARLYAGVWPPGPCIPRGTVP
jgi:ADP-ribosylglycohydrolase